MLNFSLDKIKRMLYNGKRKEVIHMAKKKRRKQKPAAHWDKKPDKNNDFWKSVLSGTLSGLIVLIVNLIIDWLTKR